MKKLIDANMSDTVYAISTGGAVTECEIYSVSNTGVEFIKPEGGRYECRLDDSKVMHGGTVSISGNLSNAKFYTLDKKKALTLAIELRNQIITSHLVSITQLTKELLHV